MRIWLIKIGEPLPIENETSKRILRVGMLAEYLQSKGHDVTWFTSGFEHQTKTLYFNKENVYKVNENYKIHYLYAPPYFKNISFKRVYHYLKIALSFKEVIKKYDKPDLIFCAFPSVQLCKLAVQYGLKNLVPVIIDIRDLWPDMITERLNLPIIKPFLNIIFYKMNQDIKYLCFNATSIMAISEQYLAWALRHAKRQKKELDKVFRLAYSRSISYSDVSRKLNDPLFVSNQKTFTVLFLGTVTQYQLEGFHLINKTARALSTRYPNIKFILAGTGDMYNLMKAEVVDLQNIEYPGWLSKNEVSSVLSKADLSINPYYEYIFQLAMGNKVAEYLSAGLPILTCLKGDLKGIIENYECGDFFNVDDEEQLISLILKYYNHHDFLKERSMNALNAFETLFNADVIHPSIEKYFEEVLSIH